MPLLSLVYQFVIGGAIFFLGIFLSWRSKDYAWGKKVDAQIVQNDEIAELAVSPEAARLLSAGVGDLIHLSDARWWLGGLRSTQAKISSLHDKESGIVFVAPALIKRGNLILRRKHRLEKIL